jgi:hypothetical protein
MADKREQQKLLEKWSLMSSKSLKGSGRRWGCSMTSRWSSLSLLMEILLKTQWTEHELMMKEDAKRDQRKASKVQ